MSAANVNNDLESSKISLAQVLVKSNSKTSALRLASSDIARAKSISASNVAAPAKALSGANSNSALVDNVESIAFAPEKRNAQRKILAEDPTWNLAPVEKLSEMCLKIIIANFEKMPILEGIPAKYTNKVLSEITTEIPISISSQLIPDDSIFWKRVATSKFTKCDPASHGGSWKKLFFETYIGKLVESYVPNVRNIEPEQTEASSVSADPTTTPIISSAAGEVLNNDAVAAAASVRVGSAGTSRKESQVPQELYQTGTPASKNPLFTNTNKLLSDLKLSAPFVNTLHIKQLRPKETPEGTIPKATDPPRDHIDTNIIFENLTNLQQVSLYYGVLDCGIDFDWNFFGMTLTDCINLTNSLKIPHVSKTLTSLKLQSSGIDDEKSRLICSALLENGTIRKLDLSHNQIGNGGARGIAKVLASSKCGLTHLNLANNKISQTGTNSIGKSLASSQLLMEANPDIVVNPQEVIISGENKSLLELNLRLNRLNDEGGADFFNLLCHNESLTTLDIAANGFGKKTVEALCALIMKNGKYLKSIDISCNKLGMGINNITGAEVDATVPEKIVEGFEDTNKAERIGSASSTHSEGIIKGETDFVGKMIFDAISHNKYITTLDLRVTDIPQEYLAAVQGILMENEESLSLKKEK